MARLALALVAALCLAAGASAAPRPEFDIPSISTINTTSAMEYVHSYASAMQAIVPGGFDPQAPQATKLLAQATAMVKKGAAAWPCGCLIAQTLETKVNYVLGNTSPGAKDARVPAIEFTCKTDADCPGVLTSCQQHSGVCKPMVYCGVVPACDVPF